MASHGISLDTLQQEIAVWERENFPDAEEWELVLGVCEEAGELAQTFLKLHRKMRQDEFTLNELRDAIGDVFVYAVGICNRRGWRLEDVLADTVARVCKRNWRSQP